MMNGKIFFLRRADLLQLFAILELVYYTDLFPTAFNCFYNLLPVKFTIAIFSLLMEALIFLTKSDF